MSCLTSCFGCALFSDTRLEPRLLFFFGGISSDRPAERARAMSDWVSHHRTIARHGHRASSRLWTNYRRMGVVPGQTIGEKWSKKSVTVVKRGGRRADLWPLLCRNPRMCSDRWLKHGHREDPDRSSGAIPSHSADAMRATCPLGARREKALHARGRTVAPPRELSAEVGRSLGKGGDAARLRRHGHWLSSRALESCTSLFEADDCWLQAPR